MFGLTLCVFLGLSYVLSYPSCMRIKAFSDRVFIQKKNDEGRRKENAIFVITCGND